MSFIHSADLIFNFTAHVLLMHQQILDFSCIMPQISFQDIDCPTISTFCIIHFDVAICDIKSVRASLNNQLSAPFSVFVQMSSLLLKVQAGNIGCLPNRSSHSIFGQKNTKKAFAFFAV